MRVLVCGGRHYNDETTLYSELNTINEIFGITELIAGDATGADALAIEWAKDAIVAWRMVVANWKSYGKSAGPIRNKRMLDMNPDVVIAFPGGKGTRNMIQQAKLRGVTVIQIPEKDEP